MTSECREGILAVVGMLDMFVKCVRSKRGADHWVRIWRNTKRVVDGTLPNNERVLGVVLYRAQMGGFIEIGGVWATPGKRCRAFDKGGGRRW